MSLADAQAARAQAAMITYALGRGLYVALTNRCNATPLFHTRGPGFSITSTRFEPLPAGFEPEPHRIVAEVAGALAARPGQFDSVVFAGLGEPTLRLRDMLAISETLKSGAAKDLPLRVSTNGIGSVVNGRDIAPELAAAGISGVTVALNTACPAQYAELMRPETPGGSLEAVCDFVRACVAGGKLEVEVRNKCFNQRLSPQICSQP
eukprot:Tamp_12778.p1 GENE.Tamp_12778~~Tamp_12778.p1  ORF type:complete len:233 (+),score=37.96 Tamp_12778:79-699(+)